MDFNKWTSVLKIILLKIVEEIERRINEKNGVTASDSFSSSVYTSLKFIVLEQVDGLVDEVVSYSKKQINELSSLIAMKTSIILASLVYVLILVGMAMLTFIFFAITFAIYLGDVLGKTYYGFLITGGIVALITLLIYLWGHQSIANRIKNHLIRMI
jgi:hypothetical protein